MEFKMRNGRGRWLGLALGGLVSLALGQPANAFTYSSGDLIGIFVDSGTELIVNFGKLADITAGQSFTFETPTGFGADGATGGKFIAYETNAPFTGTVGRNVAYTTRAGVNPISFGVNLTVKIPGAQTTLDNGTIAGFLQLLNNFPAAPNGGVIINDANRLSLLTSNGNSYTTKLGFNGSEDRIDGKLPSGLLNDNPVTGDPAQNQFNFWKTVTSSAAVSTSTLLGTLNVEGNIGGATPTTRVTFQPIPEPGTVLMIGAGLTGLAILGRRRS
jgi:hypothetical protein